ncbi:MAG: T9SS type A sorting domain-containing protein [Bacteroidales bacterium]|nr:T9SS type A sorting domain-containing protein [Bacteroidales bacterium]
MSRIKILFLIGTIITCCSIVNAQNLDNIGFFSQSGGDEFVQYSFGGTFGSVLYGENGSLTITSEYVDTLGTSGLLTGDDNRRVALGEGISVYPNPTAYFVNVSVRDSDCASGPVEIYDTNGVLVLSRAIDSFGNEFSVDLSGLANGTYIMRIGKASAKIVKQ